MSEIFNQCPDKILEGMGKLYQRCLNWFRECEKDYGGRAGLARKVGASRAMMYKVLKEDTKSPTRPNAEDFLDWLDILGAKIVFPEEAQETSRPIQIVARKANGAGDFLPPIDPEQYRAVPLVADVSAGKGRAAEETFQSWVLIGSEEPALRWKTNLLAVRIGKGEISMTPLISPEDIVVVDLDDKHPGKDGAIYLVKYPDNQGAIKRVKIFRKSGHDMIAFYSDNFQEFPPDLYDLEADYGGDITSAIVGRCIWQRSDLRDK